MPKPGRPKLPPGQAKSVQIGVRFSRVEMKSIRANCKLTGRSLTECIRYAVRAKMGEIGFKATSGVRDIKVKRRNFGKWGNE